MQRTNLVLDAQTLEEVRRVLGAKTWSETVNLSLKETLQRHKRAGILAFLGKGLWTGDLSEMRGDAKPARKRSPAKRSPAKKRG